MDPGADCMMLDRAYAEDVMNLHVYESPVKLHTANALGTSVYGITEPFLVSYGDEGNYVQEEHCALVVENTGTQFKILWGNVDFIRHQGILDMQAKTLSLHGTTTGRPVVLPITLI